MARGVSSPRLLGAPEISEALAEAAATKFDEGMASFHVSWMLEGFLVGWQDLPQPPEHTQHPSRGQDVPLAVSIGQPGPMPCTVLEA